jgi:hypothetical protein
MWQDHDYVSEWWNVNGYFVADMVCPAMKCCRAMTTWRSGGPLMATLLLIWLTSYEMLHDYDNVTEWWTVNGYFVADLVDQL